MTKKGSSRWHWLMPVGFALPVLLAVGYVLMAWGPTIRDYLSIAMKMAVIS